MRDRITAVLAATGVATLIAGAVVMGVAGAAQANHGDNHKGGANVSGPYDPTSPGPGDENQGKGKAPDNGSVGKADGKNPPGQVGNDKDRGYECDGNKGVGNKGGNPAHTGCAPTTTTTDVCPNIAGNQATVPPGYTLVDGLCERDEVAGEEEEDVCPNIRGMQESVPAGYSLVNGQCVKDKVKGEDKVTGEDKETPADKPVIKGVQAEAAPAVAPAAAPVPTSVDAGIGGPSAGSSTTTALLGQGLLGGGLTLLLLAGWMRKGRLPRGAHQV